uniref:F-box domain-containing protein n=1 Tax=Meloidogyne incognita TaxID=6306 RepID=A0A914MZB9_MELIC
LVLQKMFYSLPTEIKLDILKFFSYKELCSIKQTNLYFSAFVNNFEGELAREKLYYIYINDIDRFKKEPHKLVNPKSTDFDFPLNEQFEEKWKNGLETPIPLYLPNQDLDSNIVDCLSKG